MKVFIGFRTLNNIFAILARTRFLAIYLLSSVGVTLIKINKDLAQSKTYLGEPTYKSKLGKKSNPFGFCLSKSLNQFAFPRPNRTVD